MRYVDPDKAKILAKIEVGSKVWVGDYNYPHSDGVQTVVRMTPTLIILQRRGRTEPSEFDRYDRLGGYQKRGGMFRKSITGIAHPSGVQRWEAEQARKEAEIAARQTAATLAEQKREELSKLFADNVSISQDYNDRNYTKFRVEFHNLSEAQVRKLASLVAEAL